MPIELLNIGITVKPAYKIKIIIVFLYGKFAPVFCTVSDTIFVFKAPDIDGGFDVRILFMTEYGFIPIGECVKFFKVIICSAVPI